jgi:acyl-CoA synthetase (NDP forming)
MHSFFEPRSVVLIGVTRQTGPGAYNNLEMLLRYGYQGRIYLVHPKVSEILGRQTYRSVAELPEVPDLAVISLGRERVLPVFSECVQKGIRGVIIISQGFADADERGKELQRHLVALAGQSGTRIIGPNTMGILNAFTGFSSAFVDIPRDQTPLPLTVIAQTGVLQVGFGSLTGRVGKAVDLGNACDLDFVDVLTYLENDPQTEVIAVHMEGMKRGREFLRIAAKITPRKPIIVLKTGRSIAGAQAALSHTGSMVGEDELFDLAFARAGVIRVRDLAELDAVCKAFLHFRPMRGPRLAVATATGACGIMAADACEAYGLEMAPLPEAIPKLENPHISWHRLRNPVDLWPLGMVSGSFTEVFKQAVRLLLPDDQVDAILAISPVMSSNLHEDLDLAAAIHAIGADNKNHKPIALWLYGDGVARQYRALAQTADVACFDSIDEAIMGLAATWRYQSFRQRQAATADLFGAMQPAPSKPPPLPSEELLIGESAFSLIQQFQIPLAPGHLAQDLDEVVSAARELGFPVVLKITSPQWLHKSDWGGVCLNIHTEPQLRSSYEKLEHLFQERTPDGKLAGVLVQKQLQGTEVLIGIKRDVHFGHILVAGAGGIYTEVFKDVARSLVPVDREAAGAMLQSLRIYPRLKGTRGQPGADLPVLAEILVGVSKLALTYPEIYELDLNPVFACVDGCWCADCRIVVHQEPPTL